MEVIIGEIKVIAGDMKIITGAMKIITVGMDVLIGKMLVIIHVYGQRRLSTGNLNLYTWCSYPLPSVG